MRPTIPVCPLDIPEQKLSALLDGLLEPTERHDLERHLSECVACQRRLTSLQYVSHVLRSQREPQLTAQVWRGLQARIADPAVRRSSTTRVRVPAAAWTTAAAVLIVAMFAGVFALRGKYPSGSGSTIIVPTTTSAPTSVATSAPTSTAQATASPTSASIPAGWTKANIPDGLMPDIVVAPSSPNVAYAVNNSSAGRVVVSGSHDGGATWQTLSYPTSQANSCQIAVDPTDPTDVALACTPSSFTILRSYDGGKTWTKPALGITVNCYQTMGFADSTLLMSFSLCDGATSQTQLIASVNRGPFKRLDSNGVVSGITLTNIRLMTGHGSTYLIQMGVIEYTENNPPQLADTLIISQDAGATWKTMTLADNGANVHLLATDPLDHNWVGAYKNAPTQLAISSDSGQTWRKLPPPWANEMGPDFLFVAPDGTLLVTDAGAGYVTSSSTTYTLYEAAPGATQWRSALLIPGPGSVFARAAGWDSSGRPTTLWARDASNGGSAWYLISHPLPA